MSVQAVAAPSSAEDIRCLLISPLASSPRGYTGEDAYTDALLAGPPPGVRYSHHLSLLRQGLAGRHRLLGQAVRHLDHIGLVPGLWFESIHCDCSFELVHLHGFTARLCGRTFAPGVPVIMSASGCGLEDLSGYQGWSPAAIRGYVRRASLMCRGLALYHPVLGLHRASRLVVWSEYARRLHLSWGVPDDKLRVVPPGLPKPALQANPGADPVHLLFIGNDFERKGGPILLDAFAHVRARFPNVELTVVSAQDIPSQPGLHHIRDVSRERLFRDVYPRSQILVLPARAEGFGLVAIEAMSFGLPVIAAAVGALPEIVAHESTGWVFADLTADLLADRLTALIRDPARRVALGRAGRARFLQHFAADSTGRELREVYLEALRDG